MGQLGTWVVMRYVKSDTWASFPLCPACPPQVGEETSTDTGHLQCQSTATAPPDDDELPSGVWREEYGDLENQQQEQLRQLLVEFQGCFAMSESEVGRIELGVASSSKCV